MPVDATVPLFPPAPPVLFVPVPVPDGAVAIVVGSSPPAAEEVVVLGEGGDLRQLVGGAGFAHDGQERGEEGFVAADARDVG
ncbi:MAG: hypothetical protein LQ344_004239 [Seirophora lacunosa]|nr:MAG: hypothetical protein LQ344_004239 [Seirophora lacunosa]